MAWVPNFLTKKSRTELLIQILNFHHIIWEKSIWSITLKKSPIHRLHAVEMNYLFALVVVAQMIFVHILAQDYFPLLYILHHFVYDMICQLSGSSPTLMYRNFLDMIFVYALSIVGWLVWQDKTFDIEWRLPFLFIEDLITQCSAASWGPGRWRYEVNTRKSK